MKQRIITGLIAGSLFAALCIIGSVPYQLLLLAMACIGYFEYARMHHDKRFDTSTIIGYIAVFGLVIPWSHWGISWPISVESIMWLAMFALLCMTVLTKNKVPIQTVALLWIGAFYIGIGFKYMMLTRTGMGADGLFWTLMLFSSIWASDIGAYFIGRAIGKHKLWPAISPNKTIEGAVGGVIASVLSAVIFALVRPDVLSMVTAVGIGLAAAGAGQMGDLIQSAFKRVRGVKDSGALFPGHGGILDRVDSWIIVFPLVHILGLLAT
ncbi:phosphatidate cytidylyltransferase [Paenibacillus sp. 481]|uniref:phosphatidate cytidylyltransferase n=1 Tax=Paenibacillus sp. 481 TaxID=2835869 RepID=UPI001E3868A4|nr:phosphatidate cytidylyltransferase [Paenibacillus sp. 481]UHA73903.1 phosphatidate cytidylyltransferase [Paenibacillus sp. 481]